LTETTIVIYTCRLVTLKVGLRQHAMQFINYTRAGSRTRAHEHTITHHRPPRRTRITRYWACGHDILVNKVRK